MKKYGPLTLILLGVMAALIIYFQYDFEAPLVSEQGKTPIIETTKENNGEESIKIYFPKPKKTLNFQAMEYLKQEEEGKEKIGKEDLEEDCKFGGPYVVYRKAKLLPNWERVVLVKTFRYEDCSGPHLFDIPIFYDYAGKIVVHNNQHPYKNYPHSQGYRGPLLFFSSQKRFADCGLGNTSNVIQPSITNEAGFEAIPLPVSLYADCCQTKDEELLLVIESEDIIRKEGSNDFITGSKKKLKVFNFKGENIFSKSLGETNNTGNIIPSKSVQHNKIQFEYNNKSYELQFSSHFTCSDLIVNETR